jgi:enterochelin esterase-like enzyme
MAQIKKFLFLNTIPCALKIVDDDFKLNDAEKARGDRVLYIHQPKSDKPLGILICLDGQNEIESNITEQIESTPDILERLYQEAGHYKQLAVFIPSPSEMPSRVAEYACNSEFTQFIHDKLIPLLQKPLSDGGNFGCTTNREQIAIAGVSMSAVAAVHTALSHPTTFSKVLVQSGAFWWYRGWEKECSFDPTKLAASAGKMEWLGNAQPTFHQRDRIIKFIMQAGSTEKGIDNFPTFVSLHNEIEKKLNAMGHHVENTIIDGGFHDYGFWQKHKEAAFRQMGIAALPVKEAISVCSQGLFTPQVQGQTDSNSSSVKRPQ